MNLFVNSSNCVPIGHLEDSKIFNFCVETIFKALNRLFEMTVFEKEGVLYKKLIGESQVQLSETQVKLSRIGFIAPITLQWLTVKKVQKYFVDVKLEGC